MAQLASDTHTAAFEASSAGTGPHREIRRNQMDSTGLKRTDSNMSGRVRSASLRLAQAPIPTGAWSDIGQSIGNAPSLADVRLGGVVIDGENLAHIQRRGSGLGQCQTLGWDGTVSTTHAPNLSECKFDATIGTSTDGPSDKAAEAHITAIELQDSPKAKTSPTPSKRQPVPNELGIYPNGYKFPPPKTWLQATTLSLKSFIRFTLTPLGFLIVLYCLNVVAWGGMLFLLLCNASPAMCRLPDGTVDCNDIDSPRRIWIEYDSQILTGLFCVTAFGLAPWRFRDLWYWAVWRLGRRHDGLQRLAGYKNSWFRLRGSDELSDTIGPESSETELETVEQAALPVPRRNIPNPPLTGARAPPTNPWKLDFVVWCMVWNTGFQCVLCGFMWGFNRFDRPSWATGLFVGAACLVAGAGGLMEAMEAKRVKKVEGVPLDMAGSIADIESGGKAGGSGR